LRETRSEGSGRYLFGCNACEFIGEDSGVNRGCITCKFEIQL
jgi:hypothetical protein